METPKNKWTAHNGRAMRRIESRLAQIGASDVPVLLQGETGAGKEVLARQLHAFSSRADKPFLKLNCAALPSELVESELFGYERGAFTGAFKSTPGKFEMANGGTILLDEIGDMDFRLQAKLLQVLQDREFHRLGTAETVKVNVRVMAATHCDLETAIRDGHFREDLFYRLNVVTIQVPPLRERQDEILPLFKHFVEKYGDDGVEVELTPKLERALLAHDWPGNVRELENCVRRLLVFLDPDLVADELLARIQRREVKVISKPHVPVSPLARVAESSRQAERETILTVLQSVYWNRKQAAALLRINYKAFLYKMKKLGIEEEEQPPSSANIAAS